jgi:hypothetical protein
MKRAAKKLVRLNSRGARPRRLRRLAMKVHRLMEEHAKRILAWTKAKMAEDPNWIPLPGVMNAELPDGVPHE